MDDKTCSLCKETKPTSDFHRSRQRKDGLHPWCAPCTRAYNRSYIKRNPEGNRARARKSRIKAKYGITWQQRDQMIADQGGRCAICQTEFTNSKTTHVDHCHTSGVVRGILCYSCNTALGSFKDDVGRLNAAIEYLERYRS
ncbi:endonuclease domain-containing protein [Micromonospora saelicesensis]|uniref:endonuclease domain-containing protein n=1 Tax=Micromonospora saelicesensis TaxID=285676 RepID=UPI003D89D41C